MKKGNKRVIFIIIFLFISIFVLFTLNNNKTKIIIKPIIKVKEEYKEKITSLKKEYQNDDVKALLYIEGTSFKEVVVQGKDNNFYLSHLPNREKNIVGSVFIDYRVDIENTKKIIIYGHSSPSFVVPIMIIENYENEDYALKHPYIYLDTEKESKKYKVITSTIETSDWTYMKLDFKDNKELQNHYDYLLNKGFYQVEGLDSNDEILIIQTCSTNKKYKNYNKKYFLVIAKKVKEV